MSTNELSRSKSSDRSSFCPLLRRQPSRRLLGNERYDFFNQKLEEIQAEFLPSSLPGSDKDDALPSISSTKEKEESLPVVEDVEKVRRVDPALLTSPRLKLNLVLI